MLEPENKSSYPEADEVLLEIGCTSPLPSLQSKEVMLEYHSQFFKQRLGASEAKSYDLSTSE